MPNEHGPDLLGAQDGSARNPHRTVWRAMSDSFNVVHLTTERRERADRQRALASAYRLEAAAAHIPADVRPAVVQAVAKALKQERPDAFRRCRGLGASGCSSGGT